MKAPKDSIRATTPLWMLPTSRVLRCRDMGAEWRSSAGYSALVVIVMPLFRVTIASPAF